MLRSDTRPVDIPMPRTAPSLASQALAGDTDSWRELVAHHMTAVWSATRTAGLAGPAAAEVASLAWLQLATELDRVVRSGVDVRTWLVGVVEQQARTVHASAHGSVRTATTDSGAYREGSAAWTL